MRLLTSALLLGCLVYLVQGHSWLECVDYQDDFAQITSNAYDRTLCKGFTRGWHRLGLDVQYNFGTANWWPTSLAHSRYPFNDPGTLTEPATMYDSAETYTCRYNKNDGDDANYNAEFPMPTYSPGQRIRIVWPGVNHGGPNRASCSADPFANDQIDTLHIVCDGDGVDTSGSDGDMTIRQMLNGEALANDLKRTSTTTARWGTTFSTGKGFQNCPFHCADQVKAFCYSDLTLPENLPEGRCSFYWLWEYNDRDYYTSCWEANVLAGGAPAPNPSPPTPAPTPAPRTCRRWWCWAAPAGGAAVAAGAVAGFMIYKRKKRSQAPAHVGLTNEDSKYANARFL